MVLYEKEICDYLNIPSIPKKKWDGKKSFINGVAITNLLGGAQAYAVATFDADVDEKPRIKKVLTLEQYVDVGDIFVVPSYMDSDVENMDLDEESKESAKFLVDEANEVILEESNTEQQEEQSEYYFDNIHNDEEAAAFIRAYNKKKKGKGKVPRTHEGLLMRLSVIHSELNK